MRHFWSRRMVSVNGFKAASAGDRNMRSRNPEDGGASNSRSNSANNVENGLTKIARILQNSQSALNYIHSHLQYHGLLAASPARQAAQIAIASRCGDNATSGISFLKALSVPERQAKLFGPAVAFAGGLGAGAPNRMLLRGYEGFKSPLPPLGALPEEHSFLDLFEQLLHCAREGILERRDTWLGNTVVAGLTARVPIEYGGFVEIVKYTAQGELAGRRKDIAQFTSRTVSQLGAITEEPLVTI